MSVNFTVKVPYTCKRENNTTVAKVKAYQNLPYLITKMSVLIFIPSIRQMVLSKETNGKVNNKRCSVNNKTIPHWKGWKH